MVGRYALTDGGGHLQRVPVAERDAVVVARAMEAVKAQLAWGVGLSGLHGGAWARAVVNVAQNASSERAKRVTDAARAGAVVARV